MRRIVVCDQTFHLNWLNYVLFLCVFHTETDLKLNSNKFQKIIAIAICFSSIG